MPVFRSGDAPDWCEMEDFEIVHLKPGDRHVFERRGQKEKLIVGRGACRLVVNGQPMDVSERSNVDLKTPEGRFEVVEVTEPTILIRMCGRWGEELGGSGLFSVSRVSEYREKGDPVDYAKETGIDHHFHDCDEYWIVYEGCGVAVSEEKHYEMGPGDCLATGMGWHHDFPKVYEPVKAVYFETTMEGKKRRGHLWAHTHGAAQPVKDRV